MEPQNQQEQKTLQPHQQRVVEEHEELSDRLEKLNSFLDSEMYKSIPVEEQQRLQKQSSYMELYRNVLKERIDNF